MDVSFATQLFLFLLLYLSGHSVLCSSRTSTPKAQEIAKDSKYLYKIRVLSGLYASLEYAEGNSANVDLLANLITKMTSLRHSSHSEVTHLIIAGGLINLSSTPASHEPLEPYNMFRALFSDEKLSWGFPAQDAIMRLGSSLRKFVEAKKKFVWIPGSREFNVTIDLVSQFWRDARDKFFVISDNNEFSLSWGLLVSAGSENDFFSVPVPKERRPFSYYINRLLMETELLRKESFNQWNISHNVFSRAFHGMSASTTLSSLQSLNPKEMRRILLNALKEAAGKEELPSDLVFIDGHWNFVLGTKGSFQRYSNPWTPRSVTLTDVLNEYEYLAQDWLSEIGEVPTSKVIYATAYDDFDDGLLGMSETDPEVVIFGHTMNSKRSTSDRGAYMIALDSWCTGSNAQTTSGNSEHSPSFVDVFIGKTFTGAIRPLKVEIYNVLPSGEVVMNGPPWLREDLNSSSILMALAFFVIGVVLSGAFAVLVWWLGEPKKDYNSRDAAVDFEMKNRLLYSNGGSMLIKQVSREEGDVANDDNDNLVLQRRHSTASERVLVDAAAQNDSFYEKSKRRASMSNGQSWFLFPIKPSISRNDVEDPLLRRKSTANDLICQYDSLRSQLQLDKRETDRLIRTQISNYFRDRKIEKLTGVSKMVGEAV